MVLIVLYQQHLLQVCVAPTDPAIICADPIELDAINPSPNVILEAAGDELLEPIVQMVQIVVLIVTFQLHSS